MTCWHHHILIVKYAAVQAKGEMGGISDLGCFGVMCVVLALGLESVLCHVSDQSLPLPGKWGFISLLFENELFNQNWLS